MRIISLLNGTYGTSRPDTIHLPEFLTKSDGYSGELIESLLNMRNSGRTKDPGRLTNGFFNIIKRVIMDSEVKNIAIHINTAPIYPGIKGEAVSDSAVNEHEEGKPAASAAEEATVQDPDREEPAAEQEEQRDKEQKEIPRSESVTQKGCGRPAEPKNGEEDPSDVRSSQKTSSETKRRPAGKSSEDADGCDAQEGPSAGCTVQKAKTDELTRLKSKNAARDKITALKRKETGGAPQKAPEKREQPKKMQSHGLLTRLFGGTEEKKKVSPKQGRAKVSHETKKVSHETKEEDSRRKTK